MPSVNHSHLPKLMLLTIACMHACMHACAPQIFPRHVIEAMAVSGSQFSDGAALTALDMHSLAQFHSNVSVAWYLRHD